MRGGSVSAARAAEIESVIDRVTRWASGRGDVAGLLLVGSCARGAARPSSDVDFVLLTTAPYAVASAAGSAIGEPTLTRSWGPITERRFVTPVDPGTLRVVTDGACSLYDPAGLLAALLGAAG
ncbi:hypothetical protein GCM10027176_19940 [Actinoallomurus bryophytorum]|uniref:Nucleotidyltransferase-like protein n=1 Tax=Actinoallomurus bryophytorum TaxID=1490222 RepID=A0A543CKU5_9ACTN|nr:nucleotidyltransferase domain-containing protein [Actinoallomurus bryophytorum]TQL97728.1 nucleotidyltransferase-like protein [Actinoallomurus bryophytorum]